MVGGFNALSGALNFKVSPALQGRILFADYVL